jgi:hypothetical protein
MYVGFSEGLDVCEYWQAVGNQGCSSSSKNGQNREVVKDEDKVVENVVRVVGSVVQAA